MCSEHHRAPRHSFVAGIQLADLQSEKQLAAHIENLNLLGCFVETVTPFPEGTKVRLKISHAGVNFSALGKVAYSRPQSGMESPSPRLSLATCQSWMHGSRT